MYKKSNLTLWERCVAFVVTFVLMWTTIAYSAADTVYRMRVPEELGHVVSRWKAPENQAKTVLLIQDAHASLEAQENIAGILHALIPQVEQKIEDRRQTTEIRPQKTEGLSQINNSYLASDLCHLSSPFQESTPFISVEGAVGEINTACFRAFPLREARNLVAHDYLKKGVFTGPEYGAITADQSFQLYGAENEELFQRNLNAFRVCAKERETAIIFLSTFEKELRAKKNIFNETLKQFDHTASQYEEGSISVAEYVPMLIERAYAAHIDISSYPNLLALSHSVSTQANNNTLIDMVADIARLTESVRMALTCNDDERHVVRCLRATQVLQKVVRIEITADELEQYRAEIDEVLEKNNGDDFPLYVRTCIRNAVSFYHDADKRSDALVDNTLQRMDEKRQDVGVLITGGYHTKRIIERLKERQVNYMVISPTLDTAHATSTYLDKMTGNLFSLVPQMVGTITGQGLFLEKNPIEFWKHVQRENVAETISQLMSDILAVDLNDQVHKNEDIQKIVQTLRKFAAADTNRYIVNDPEVIEETIRVIQEKYASFASAKRHSISRKEVLRELLQHIKSEQDAEAKALFEEVRDVLETMYDERNYTKHISDFLRAPFEKILKAYGGDKKGGREMPIQNVLFHTLRIFPQRLFFVPLGNNEPQVIIDAISYDIIVNADALSEKTYAGLFEHILMAAIQTDLLRKTEYFEQGLREGAEVTYAKMVQFCVGEKFVYPYQDVPLVSLLISRNRWHAVPRSDFFEALFEREDLYAYVETAIMSFGDEIKKHSTKENSPLSFVPSEAELWMYGKTQLPDFLYRSYVARLLEGEQSQFHRYPDQYTALIKEGILPRIYEAQEAFRRTGAQQCITIGIVGASFGYEPITMSILVDQAIKKALRDADIYDDQAITYRIHVLSKGNEVFQKVMTNDIVYLPQRIKDAFRQSIDSGELFKTYFMFNEDKGGYVRSEYLNERMAFYPCDITNQTGFPQGLCLDVCLIHNVLTHAAPFHVEYDMRPEILTGIFSRITSLLAPQSLISIVSVAETTYKIKPLLSSLYHLRMFRSQELPTDVHDTYRALFVRDGASRFCDGDETEGSICQETINEKEEVVTILDLVMEKSNSHRINALKYALQDEEYRAHLSEFYVPYMKQRIQSISRKKSSVDSFETYAAFLKTDSRDARAEIAELAENLRRSHIYTTSTTSWFRNEFHLLPFEEVERFLHERMKAIALKNEPYTMRVRHVASSTGEEVYSLMLCMYAMLRVVYGELKKENRVSLSFEEWKKKWNISIDAFDLSAKNLAATSKGLYAARSFDTILDKATDYDRTVEGQIEDAIRENRIPRYVLGPAASHKGTAHKREKFIEQYFEKKSRSWTVKQEIKDLFMLRCVYIDLANKEQHSLLAHEAYDITSSRQTLHYLLKEEPLIEEYCGVIDAFKRSENPDHLFIVDDLVEGIVRTQNDTVLMTYDIKKKLWDGMRRDSKDGSFEILLWCGILGVHTVEQECGSTILENEDDRFRAMEMRANERKKREYLGEWLQKKSRKVQRAEKEGDLDKDKNSALESPTKSSKETRLSELSDGDLEHISTLIVGDIHDQYENFIRLLKKARFINDALDWIGGNRELVQLGDVMDRGNYEEGLKIWDVLEKLQKQAPSVGGKVVRIMGNHELKYLDEYCHKNMKKALKRGMHVPHAFIWKELITKAVLNGEVVAAHQIGNRIAVHGGVVRELSQGKSVETLVGEFNAELLNAVKASENGNFNVYRGGIFSRVDREGYPGICTAHFEKDLKPSAEELIPQLVAHIDSEDRSIRTAGKNDRIVNIDVSMDNGGSDAWCVMRETQSTAFSFPASLNMDGSTTVRERYRGYDALIVTSNDEQEAQEKKKLLEELFSQVQTENAYGKHKVLIVSTTVQSSEGQLLSQMRAMHAFEEAAKAVGIEEVNTLMRQGKLRVGIFQDGGEWTRGAFLTSALSNTRGFLPLVIGGNNDERSPLIANVILQENKGINYEAAASIDTWWTDGVLITAEKEASFPFLKAAYRKMAIPVDRQAIDPKELHDSGLFLLNKEGEVAAMFRNKQFAYYDDEKGVYVIDESRRHEWDQEGMTVAYDCGSFEMSPDLLYDLYEYWRGKGLFRDGGTFSRRDLEPYVTEPMSMLLDVDIDCSDISSPEKLRDMDPAVRADVLAEPIQRIYEGMVSYMQRNSIRVLPDALRESIEFYLLYRDRSYLKSKHAFIGVSLLDKDTIWLRYKRPIDIANTEFRLLADLTVERPYINEGGTLLSIPGTSKDQDEARMIRMKTRHISDDAVCDFKVMHPDGTMVSVIFSKSELYQGIEKEGVYVKGSIIQDSILFPGSRIENSIVYQSWGKIISKGSHISQCTARDLEVHGSYLLRVNEADQLSAKGQCVVDSAHKDFNDERFYRGYTRISVPLSYNPTALTGKTFPDEVREEQDDRVYPGNVYSGQCLKSLQFDRAWSEKRWEQEKMWVMESGGYDHAAKILDPSGLRTMEDVFARICNSDVLSFAQGVRLCKELVHDHSVTLVVTKAVRNSSVYHTKYKPLLEIVGLPFLNYEEQQSIHEVKGAVILASPDEILHIIKDKGVSSPIIAVDVTTESAFYEFFPKVIGFLIDILGHSTDSARIRKEVLYRSLAAIPIEETVMTDLHCMVIDGALADQYMRDVEERKLSPFRKAA